MRFNRLNNITGVLCVFFCQHGEDGYQRSAVEGEVRQAGRVLFFDLLAGRHSKHFTLTPTESVKILQNAIYLDGIPRGLVSLNVWRGLINFPTNRTHSIP